MGLEWVAQFCVLPTKDKIYKSLLLLFIFVPQTVTFSFIGGGSSLNLFFFQSAIPGNKLYTVVQIQLLLYFYMDSTILIHCVGLTFRNARIQLLTLVIKQM